MITTMVTLLVLAVVYLLLELNALRNRVENVSNHLWELKDDHKALQEEHKGLTSVINTLRHEVDRLKGAK